MRVIGTLILLALASAAQAASISWDGGGDGTTWGDPLNWSGDALPGASDDVTIDVAGAITVEHTSGGTAIISLLCEEDFRLTGGSLTVTGTSTVNGVFTHTSYGTLTASGSGASFTVANASTGYAGDVYAQAGGVVSFLAAGIYTSVNGRGDSMVWASGVGSRLDLSGITTLSGPTGDWRNVLSVSANSGGAIDMSGLVTVDGHTGIQVMGDGSAIDLSSLSTIDGSGCDSDSDANFQAVEGGSISAPSLTSATRTAFYLSGIGSSFSLPVPLVGQLKPRDVPLCVPHFLKNMCNMKQQVLHS